jgi:hypothetical protein
MKNFIIGLCVFIAAMTVATGCGGNVIVDSGTDGSISMMDGSMPPDMGVDGGTCQTLTIGDESNTNLSVVYNGGLVVKSSTPIVLRSIQVDDQSASSSAATNLLNESGTLLGAALHNHMIYTYSSGLMINSELTVAANSNWVITGTVTLCYH